METIDLTPDEFLTQFAEWDKQIIGNHQGVEIFLLSTSVEGRLYRTECSATGRTPQEVIRLGR